MLSEDEKLGGLLINPTCIRAFRHCLDNCGLSTQVFTAKKHPNQRSNIKERLDIVDWQCQMEN